MAKAKRCIPGLAKWDTYGGGTSCPDRVRNYGYHKGEKGNYAIDALCPRGRLTGYRARFENVKGLAKRSGLHQMLSSDGWPDSDFSTTTFRSPAQAANAANKHCLLMNQGLAGARRRRRRR